MRRKTAFLGAAALTTVFAVLCPLGAHAATGVITFHTRPGNKPHEILDPGDDHCYGLGDAYGEVDNDTGVDLVLWTSRDCTGRALATVPAGRAATMGRYGSLQLAEVEPSDESYSQDPSDYQDPSDSRDPSDSQDPSDSRDSSYAPDESYAPDPSGSGDPSDSRDSSDSRDPSDYQDPSDSPADAESPAESPARSNSTAASGRPAVSSSPAAASSPARFRKPTRTRPGARAHVLTPSASDSPAG
ncbi:chitin-binding protein [Streptomyces inhibens]|uniref:chitin-binding protein n=1 Tax=Streptomyces inhibens TaxID=2293571 RepID=UPI00402AF57F